MVSRFMLALAAGLTLAAPGYAQDYPSKPIRLVLPFPPGGGTDSLARILAEKMSASLGQQVTVDNRPGAAGNIAGDIVAKAEPDGYTLLIGFSTALTVNPSMYDDMAFDVQTDFDPITLIADAQYILVVHPSVEVTSVEELVAYAKEHPGELNYSSSGVGSPLHLAGELFKDQAGIEIEHIPYDGGGPAGQAVLGGEVQMLFGSVAAVQEHVAAGTLTALATTGLEPSDALPDLPTMDASGFEGFNVSSWYGLLAPAGTPQEVRDRLHEEVVKALADPDVQSQLADRGLTPIGGDSQALADLIASETETWAVIVEKADIRPTE